MRYVTEYAGAPVVEINGAPEWNAEVEGKRGVIVEVNPDRGGVGRPCVVVEFFERVYATQDDCDDDRGLLCYFSLEDLELLEPLTPEADELITAARAEAGEDICEACGR